MTCQICHQLAHVAEELAALLREQEAKRRMPSAKLYTAERIVAWLYVRIEMLFPRAKRQRSEASSRIQGHMLNAKRLDRIDPEVMIVDALRDYYDDTSSFLHGWFRALKKR